MGDADTLVQWDILIKLQRSLMQGGGNWVLHSALRTIFLFFFFFLFLFFSPIFVTFVFVQAILGSNV